MSAPAHSDSHSHSHTHTVPIGVYVAVLSCLIVLTAVTVLVARADFGWLNNPIALGIAITKTTLVVLFFMHVKYSTRLIGLAVLASAFWLLILFFFLLSDYLTRGMVNPLGGV